MTLASTTVWEIRAAGSINGGGGYNSARAGAVHDYSQQDNPQASIIADLLGAGSTSKLYTIETAPFTAEMVGNIIHIRSTGGFTEGYYEIFSFEAADEVTLDRSPGNGTNGTGYVGGAGTFGWTSDYTNSLLGSVVAGNTVYVKGGNHTLVGNISAGNGTAVLPIKIIGYAVNRGDNPTGGTRPVIVGGVNNFTFGNYWWIQYLSLSTTAQYGLKVGTNSHVMYCHSDNTSVSANYYAFYGAGSTSFIHCSGSCTLGVAIGLVTTDNRVLFCTLGGTLSDKGILSAGTSQAGNVIIGNIIKNCTTYGVQFASTSGWLVLNNVIYACGTGLYGTTMSGVSILNNIISGCTTAANWTTGTPENLWDYNYYYNSSTTTNITKGSNDVVGVITDLMFVDAPGGDFRLLPGSPCLNTGLATIGSGFMSKGAWQQKQRSKQGGLLCY